MTATSLSHDMAPRTTAPAGQRGLRISYETVLNAVVFLLMSSSSISFIEPSPYDFLSLVAIPMWLLGGVRIHRSLVFVLLLWAVYAMLGMFALLPYWHEPDPRLYQLQSLYLFVTLVFFTLYLSENSVRRFEVAMLGFTVSAIFAALVGIAGYLNIAGLGEYATMYEGRANGPFKDPNVLGSYLVLAAVYLMNKVMTGTARSTTLTLLGFGIVMLGIFLSFSRGAWGATVVALATMTVYIYMTAPSAKARRRILIATALGFALVALALAIVLSNEATRELLFIRANATQDYDVGATGRFGNQLRSLLFLLDNPMGYGPLRFRLTFDLDPHNSYIGAFANYGWLGGLIWLFLAVITLAVGLRLMWRPSAYRAAAQVVVPATVVLYLQGMQIDVDHWRWLYFCIGAVWALEAARQRDEARAVRAVQIPAVGSFE